jgi:hypothetical protein
MPPIAICSRQGCDYRISLHDNECGKPISTPANCPNCGSKVISMCPQCSFLLLGSPNTEHPYCQVCRADIRGTYAKRRVFDVRPDNHRSSAV